MLKTILIPLFFSLIFTACSNVKMIKVKQVRDSQENKISMQIDSVTHKARVADSIITNDKKYVITCSDDKTINLTNLETGRVEHKYLGERGTGFGGVYAIALSKDEKYLAAGGWFAEGGYINKNKLGWIRIYDFKTGKIVKILKGHLNVITDLRFSNDGKYFISSSADTSIEVRRLPDFKSIKVYKYSKYVNEFKLFNHKIFSIDNSWEVKIRDIETGKILHSKSLLFDMITRVPLPNLLYIAVTKNNIAISTGQVQDDIIILDHNLKIKKHIHLQNGAAGLTYSSDGKYLIVGEDGGKKKSTRLVRVYDVPHNYKLLSTFDKFIGPIPVVGFIDKNRAYGIGGYQKNIRIWNFHTKYELKHIKNIGHSKLAVAFIKNKVIWRNEVITLKKKLDQYFDIKELKLIHKTIDISNTKRLPLTYKNYKLKHSLNKRGLILFKNSYKQFVLIDNSKHMFYGFYKNHIISSNKNGTINIFTLQGKQIYSLQGHTGKIFSIHFNKDFIVSSGEDKTIRFWKYPTYKNNKDIQILNPVASLFINNKDWILWTQEGYFTEYGNITKNIYFHINNGFDKEATEVSIDKIYDHFFRPDLVKLKLQGIDISMFTNGLTYQEVLKTPPPTVNIKLKKINKKKRVVHLNFYISQNNNGGIGTIRIYQEGKLVKSIGTEKINRTLANVHNQLREEQLNTLLKQKQAQYLALKESVSKSITNNELTFKDLVGKVKITSSNNKEGLYSVTLPIKSGKNSISIEAFNKTNTVSSIRENIVFNAKIPKYKSKVYAIVIGVNNFEQHSVSPLKYSENDAKSIAEEIKKATQLDTFITLLLGKNVTKENIFDTITKIKNKAHLEDKILFYISTHGKAVKGQLYLVPSNNLNLKNWIKFENIFSQIQLIPALEQIFIIDACESGSASNIMSAVYDAKASALAKQSGVHLLMATTKGTYAFESRDKNIHHGVFTHNILKALNSHNTDKNNDKIISILELSKTLQETKYRAEQQFPIIRNVGEDTKIKELKK